MRHSLAALCAVAFALAGSAPADARAHRVHGRHGGRVSANAYAPSPQPRPACFKLCAQDRQPCDPIYFKTADGRCNPENEYY